MSYDLRIAVKVAGVPKGQPDLYAVIAEPTLANPTYNLGPMFRACTEWDYEQGEYYNVAEVYPKIERGIHELIVNADAYLKYNPSNGWGSIGAALNTLKSLKECIDENDNPDGFWGCHTIPKELLYVAW